MKKIIITGINGQLAQHMVKFLLETEPDAQIIGTIRQKSYDAQPSIFDQSKITIESMDLGDPHSVESIILKHKPDYFINTAAAAFVGESWTTPALYFEVNALSVLHQLEAVRKHSPKTRYFTMGTSEEFARTEKGILNEKSPLLPLSPYGASKCASRHIVRVWRESYSLYAVQGWTFNFESEIRGEKYVTRKITKGVARIHDAINRSNFNFNPIELGNIDSFRSWQHAEDVARGVWLMLNQDVKNFKEYVLSAPDVHNVREFVEKAFAVAGIKGFWSNPTGKPELETYIWIPDGASAGPIPLVCINPKFYRPADVTYLHGDASAIKKDLGWEPQVPFDVLVSRMVKNDIENYKTN